MQAPASPVPARHPVILAPILFMRSFIRQDLDTLALRYQVREAPCLTRTDMVRSLFALRGADLVFCWFGSLRFLPLVLLARLLGKPVVVISGGYDVANEAAIDYGNMRGGVTAFFGRLVFRLASVVVPYSRAGQAETTRNARVPESKQRLIYLGFPPMGSANVTAKRLMALTVGRMDESTIHRKGLLTIARMSHLLPEMEIVMAGGGSSNAMAELQREAGPNVQFPGIVSDEVLQQLLSEAAVYLQPSVHEAFGCAVAEAMLYGCVPVVSDRGSLPEVVGDTGLYVPPDDPQALAAAVRQALRSPATTLTETPRARVLRMFPLEKRQRDLHSLVDALCRP
jgi:glycosyltransferase involved in cell wall biosynthesis